jgi:hypothetical protein
MQPRRPGPCHREGPSAIHSARVRDVSFSLQCSEVLVLFFRKIFVTLNLLFLFYYTVLLQLFFKSFRASLRIYVCEREAGILTLKSFDTSNPTWLRKQLSLYSASTS